MTVLPGFGAAPGIGILTEIVHAARNRLLETRTADALKAAEMLAKMCGWQEPERVQSCPEKIAKLRRFFEHLRGRCVLNDV